MRARGAGGVQEGRPGGADGLPGAGLRRWGWRLGLGQGRLLQGRLVLLGLRRCRGHVGCSGIIRHVKCDSPGKAGKV
jgi:hypothetical protein